MPGTDATAELKRRLDGELAGVAARGERSAIASAAGRIDVLGGLAAEAGGTLAQMPVPKRASVFVQRRSDAKLVIRSVDIEPPVGEAEVVLPVSELVREGMAGLQMTPAKELKRKVAGAAAWAAPIVALWHVLGLTPAAGELRGAGMTFVVHSEIPMGASQASSTAMLAAALLGVQELGGFELETLDAALLIHRAEELFTASAGHVVDALACLSADEGAGGKGKGKKLMRFSAQPHSLVSQSELPGDLRVMALDTGVRYTAAGATVGAIRLAGAMGLRIVETIYRDLGQRHTPLHGYLANLSPSLYRQYFRALLPKRLRGGDFLRTYGELSERAGGVDQKKLYRVRAAVDHLVTENEFAENFLQSIEELADPALSRQMTKREKALSHQRAGRLLLASHHSYSLRLELSCREADWLVDHLMEAGPAKGIFGARISGCGGGGTVVALLNRSSAANDALLDTMKAYQKMTGVVLGVSEAGSGE